MKGAFLEQPGEVRIRELPEPEPGPGEVVVKVQCALTCGTDLKAFRRGHPLISMPGPFGHQWSGIVWHVGPQVKGFEPGVPVMGVDSAPCMQCRACRRNRYSLCQRFSENLLLGAFGQYLRVPPTITAHNLLRRPERLSEVRAAFLEPISCVVHALRQIDWKGVERVLVLGLGSMGLLFARLIPKFASVTVVGVGRGEERLAVAVKTGLEEVFDAGSAPWRERIAALEGFDCVIECTGQPDGWRLAFDLADPGAQVMFFGGLRKGTKFEIDTYRMHYEEMRLLGSFHFGPPDVRTAAEILQDDDVVVEDLISGRMGLDRLTDALQLMADSKGIKYAIDPWSDSGEELSRL